MNSWSDTITQSFQDLWDSVIGALPTFLAAIVVLIVGLALASALGKIAARILRVTKIDNLLEKFRLSERFSTSGVRFSITGLVGWVIKWFVIIVTLIAFAEILEWSQLTDFLTRVALYVPNVLVAIFIITIGLIFGRYIGEVVQKGVSASRLPTSSASFLKMLAEWSIIIFSVMAALTQLGIAAGLIQVLFTGLVAALAIAFGLAFGLGGRDKAQSLLEKLDQEIKKE
jgi:hypothetical protein